MAFPDNLRRLRLGQFLSQAELARRSGVHALTITRLESGRTAPSTRTVRALAQALGISPADLATPEEVQTLAAELTALAADRQTLLSLPRIFQVWGRRQ